MTVLEATVEIVKAAFASNSGTQAYVFGSLVNEQERKSFLKGIAELHGTIKALNAGKSATE